MILRITREKVGHRQGPIQNAPPPTGGAFSFVASALFAFPKARGQNGSMQPARTSAALARLVAFWDRLRSSPGLKGAFLLAVVASLMALATMFPNPRDAVVADLERVAFDQQMRLLRAFHPRPLGDDVVLIGTDEETYQVFEEPVAL